MGRKGTPGDTCIIEGCNEPRDNGPGQRRRICRKHVYEQQQLNRVAQRQLAWMRRVTVADVYSAWGDMRDVGIPFHDGQRIIGLKLVGTYFVATFDSLTSAPLASDAVVSIG